MSVSREKLYEEVWLEPMTTVAQRYDVSSSFLARVCERMGVPRPSRGYWAQRAAGIEVEREELPPPEPGADLEWVRDGSEPKRQPLAAPTSIEPARKAKHKRKQAEQHPLLQGAEADFAHAHESRDQRYVRPYKRNLADVFVSKELVERALKFTNDLFLALEERGHRVVLAPASRRFHRRPSPEVCEGKNPDEWQYDSPGRWCPARPTLVLVGETAFGITVFEISEEVEVQHDSKLRKYVRITPAKSAAIKKARAALGPGYSEWSTTRWMASGRLGLHVYAYEQNIEWSQYWREANAGELYERFDAISKRLKAAVPEVAKLIEKRDREAEEWRRKWEEQQKVWKREQEERQRAAREAERQKQITDTITNWRTARDVRAYVAEVRALVEEAGMKFSEGGRGDEELTWALAYADRIDPLTSWRKEVDAVKAEHDTKPCPDCGQVHGAEQNPNAAERSASAATAAAGDTACVDGESGWRIDRSGHASQD
jgi:hypothetical protein